MRTALAAALAVLSLCACTTERITPAPSPAIVEARAKAQAARTTPADRCGLYAFATAVPLEIPFPYNQTTLTDEGSEQLDHAAVWLVCHPQVWANLSGQHDNQGDPAARQAIVEARIGAVRQRLAAGGVSAARLLTYKPASGEVLDVQARGRGW